MLVGLLATPAALAVIVGILFRNARAGILIGAVLLCVEFAVLAYPHHEIRHCELSDNCRAGAPPG